MPGAFTGYYFDGRSAARRPASIRLAASGLEIALADGARLWWPFREVSQTQGFYRGAQISPYTFRVTVVDDGTVNAFAVPGGQVVLLRGLVERTRTPEELAGVLAHELQHVIQRHATRLLLQHASTGLVLVAVSGDITGAMAYGIESARMLGTLRYSRHLESEADVEGLRMLLAADVDPRGMIAFFETMRAAERGAPATFRYLTSHPLAADRVEALKQLAGSHTKEFRPLLPGRDWADVRRVCGG